MLQWDVDSLVETENTTENCTNWNTIQVCLIIVAMTTEVRHTWINQIVQWWQTGNKGAGWSSGSSAAVHRANLLG